MSPINHMKLAPDFKPHLCASKDASRHILQNVCVRLGMAIATDLSKNQALERLRKLAKESETTTSP